MGKYFITPDERQGSCYYEFFAGEWKSRRMKFWDKSSICISAENWSETGFEALISAIVEDYKPYGPSKVREKEWKLILQKAEIIGGELWMAVSEAKEWAVQNFSQNEIFTILGI